MFGTTFYHASARKLIIAFASVFSNIHCQRDNTGITTVTAGNFIAGDEYTIITVGTTDYTLIGATSITSGAFVVGTKYVIVTAGTTDYTLIGAADSVAGTIFTATGVGAGNGTALTAVFTSTGGGSGTGTVSYATGSITDILVPIAYESQKKYLARLVKDTVMNRQVPRMGFVMSGMEIDTSRMGNQMNELRFSHSDPNQGSAMYTPIPYNFNFTLDVYVDYMEDGLQIVEQILPYFSPDFNVVVEEIPSLNIKRDVPITLGGITLSDEFEGEFGDHRIVNWTLDFTMKGWIYPPLRSGKVIKDVLAKYKLSNEFGNFDFENSPVMEQVRETVDPAEATAVEAWEIKVEVGHPDNPNDPNDVDSVTTVAWPLT
jgi:hypothetical protein